MWGIRIARILFALLMAAEVVGLAGYLPWTPAFSWVGLIMTAGAVWIVLERLAFPGYLWLLVFCGVLVDSISDVFLLYSRVEDWDRLMHLMGGALLAVGAWHVIERLPLDGMTARLRVFFAVTVTALFGIFYEAMEWGIDVFYFGYARSLGDGPDTVDDLLLNLVGGLIAAGIVEYARGMGISIRVQVQRRLSTWRQRRTANAQLH